jgi:hypothetical protein
MKQPSQEAINAACRALGIPTLPAQRYAIQKWKTQPRSHPLDRKNGWGGQHRILIDTEIPTESGIYFFWRKGTAFYVGQAINLQQRLTNHDKKAYCDEVAWILCEDGHLHFTECFYIGALRPIANFGGIKIKRIDEGETYYDVEHIGELTLTRTQSYPWPVEIPLPPGAVLRFPGSAN